MIYLIWTPTIWMEPLNYMKRIKTIQKNVANVSDESQNIGVR